MIISQHDRITVSNEHNPVMRRLFVILTPFADVWTYLFNYI